MSGWIMMAMRRSVRGYAASVRVLKRRFHQQTVQQALRDVRVRLGAAGVSGSDAKALIAHALQPKLASSNDVFLWTDHQLRLEEANKLTEMVERRCQGEPLAYVVGVKEFWSLEFHVSKDTLIPRSDSEVLIETLTNLYSKTSSLRILDLGTGSGCLLLSALSEYPQASGLGIDISAGALQVASGNSQRLAMADRSTFIEYDMENLSHLDETSVAPLYQCFDVILCNPPYIPLSEVPLIAADVLAHEPHGALFSDGPLAWKDRSLEDNKAHQQDDLGLRFYIALSRNVEKLLDPVSAVASSVLIEIGSERQAHAVKDLFTGSPVVFDRFLMDAEDRYRGVLLTRKRP